MQTSCRDRVVKTVFESCGNLVATRCRLRIPLGGSKLSRPARRALVVVVIDVYGSGSFDCTLEMAIWPEMNACKGMLCCFHSARSTSNTSHDGLSPCRGAAPTIRPINFAFAGITRPLAISTASSVLNCDWIAPMSGFRPNRGREFRRD